MQRIVILGCTGSGKTTFGKKLAAKLGCESVDLDELHWLPGWQTRGVDDFRARVFEKSQMPSWVIMGNYSKTRDMTWPYADTFIWIDLPFFTVFRQLLSRSVRRARDKLLICNGNTETWRKLFSSDSIMLWLLKTYGKRKKEYGEIFGAGNVAGVTYIRLRSHAEADAFLQNLKP